MKITAPDLKELGVIDEIVHEVKGGAHRDVAQQSEYIDSVLQQSIVSLSELTEEELIEQRYQKYKNIGQFSYVNDVTPVNKG